MLQDNGEIENSAIKIIRDMSTEPIFSEVVNTILLEQIVCRLISQEFFKNHIDILNENKVVYVNTMLNSTSVTISLSTLNDHLNGLAYGIINN